MATAQEKALQAALRRYSPAIEKAFLQAIEDTRNAVDIRALVDALRAGDLDRAVAIIDAGPARATALQEAVRAAYIQAGINTVVPNAIAGVFSFDGRNPRAETWLRANAGDLVQVVRGNEEARAAIREFMVQGRESGKSVNSIALDIVGRRDPITKKVTGGVIGLTAQQIEYAMNARDDLENLDARYFTRKLRDKRFDKLVRKAIREGEKLSRLDVDRITARYRDKMLAYRGKMIARNEAMQSMAAAQFEAHMQMAALPNVAGVTKRWLHTLNAKTAGFNPNVRTEPRLDHVLMSGTVIPVNQDFYFGAVGMAHPHDPRGGAAHSIGCRCICVYRVELR